MKAEHAKVLEDAYNRHRTKPYAQLTAFRQVVEALKEAYLQKWKKVRRRKYAVKRDQQTALTQHERVVDKHMSSVLHALRRADTTEKTAAALEVLPQSVYVRCSSPERKTRKRPERLSDGLEKNWKLSGLNISIHGWLIWRPYQRRCLLLDWEWLTLNCQFVRVPSSCMRFCWDS